MLNRLSSVLQSAADALAPPPPPLEDLKYHWKMVMRFYAQRTIQSKCPIEETNIPSHLEQLLRILIAEDAQTKNVNSEGPCSAAGPCLEFLLQHRLLELLVSLARADSPPGMRRYLLGYLQRLVGAISPHLLTLASIHLPLLRIVILCSQSKASPTEAEEIEFLLALCQIIHRHPYLSIIFNKETKPTKKSGSSSTVSSNNLTQVDSNSATGVTSTQQDLGIESGQDLSDKDEKVDHALVEHNGKVTTVTETGGENISVGKKGDDSDIKVQIKKEEHNPEEKNTAIKNSVLDSSKNFNCEKLSDSLSLIDKRGTDLTLVSESSDGAPLKTERTKDTSERNEKEAGQADDVFSRTTSGSCTPEPFLLEDCPEPELEGRLPLLDAVLGYINSADSVTKLHVCEALLMLVSVADEVFSSSIVRTSNLGLAMAEKLISSFQEIPTDIDPDHLEDIPQNWGPKSSQLWLEQHVFPGSRLIASFVSWLNFCDQLAVESPMEVSESVVGAVRALFFEIELESELRTGDVARQQLISNIICLSLRHITSNIFLSELNIWLMGEVPEDTAQIDENSLKQLLLNNCLSPNNGLGLISMRLFELLLENSDEHVLDCLVLTYLKGRKYYDASSVKDKTYMESWSDEEDARELDIVKNKQGADSGGVSSRTFAPSNIHKIIDSFLQLLPSSLRSATDYQESGYHQYIAEAQRQYSSNVQTCAPLGWGTEAAFSDEENTTLNKTFNEGPFLHMIFTRLRGLANQPYEMNLQLTALVSRLAMLPHPNLHEYLLNPLLPMTPGTTTLYSTLQAVAHDMQTAIASIPNSKKMLVRTRQELLGDVSYLREFPSETFCLFESVVVLEEFCKELAAIAYVKYHHSS